MKEKAPDEDNCSSYMTNPNIFRHFPLCLEQLCDPKPPQGKQTHSGQQMTNCLQITQITSYTRQKTKIPKMTVPQRRAQTGHSSTPLSKKQLGAGQCENPATARSSLLFQQPLDTSQQCPQHQGWAGQPQISLEKRKSQNPISGFWREASSSWAPS